MAVVNTAVNRALALSDPRVLLTNAVASLLQTDRDNKWQIGDIILTELAARSGVQTPDYHSGAAKVCKQLMLDLAERGYEIGMDSLLDRFTTSQAFPPEKRHKDVSWTIHYELAKRGRMDAERKMVEFLKAYPNAKDRTKKNLMAWLEEQRVKPPMAKASSSPAKPTQPKPVKASEGPTRPPEAPPTRKRGLAAVPPLPPAEKPVEKPAAPVVEKPAEKPEPTTLVDDFWAQLITANEYLADALVDLRRIKATGLRGPAGEPNDVARKQLAENVQIMRDNLNAIAAFAKK